MQALEIKNLNVNLGTFKLDNLNLTVRKGAITGLIGANGAGKSTLIKTVMRAQNAESGSILYNGIQFAGNEREVLSSVACVFDAIPFSTYAKPKNIVKIYRDIYPHFDMHKYEELTQKFSLPQNLRVTKYSFGMQKKLNFILALCQGADTLILDEPTSGVDPYDRNEIITLIQEYMLNENHSVLFSTHITEDLDKIADYIVMIDRGRIILDSDKESLAERFRIVRAPALTAELQQFAIGAVRDNFGCTFLTKNISLTGDELQVRIPTVEEVFVHLLNQTKAPSDGSSYDIFGI